jgi:Methyltransferase domain
MQIIVKSIWKFGDWAYDEDRDTFIRRWRRQRIQAFLDLVQPPKGASIVDLGGSASLWNLIDHDFQVTIVNLPGNGQQTSDLSGYRYVEGDATNLKGVFTDQSFDVAFSNSTIEHVGDEAQQAALASEIMRLGRSYYVQTPSDRCPIEPHTGLPFYWKYPEFVRAGLLRSWQKKTPGFAEYIAGTRVLSRDRMQALFPGAQFYIERRFGCEKCYAVYQSFR